MVAEAKNTCQCCGKKKTSAKQLDVHHLTPSFYSLLEPKRFKVLCTDCHLFVERMALRLVGKDPFPNKEAFLGWAGPFLPELERTVDRFMTPEALGIKKKE